MFRSLVLASLLLLLTAAHCQPPEPPGPEPPPRPGDTVQLRGVLSEDVDCRLLRAEGGTTYSLNVRLSRYTNGTRICIVGTIAVISQCLSQPTIEVTQVRAWSSCP